jgi:two-component system NtrC family sensor kinase
MAPRSRSRSSLARSTLIKMGGRIAIIIALTTLVSYLHIFRSMRAETLANLEKHVSERSQREQGVFVLAVDTHARLKQALKERIRAASQEDPSARFDSLFARLPDGTIRNHPQGFDGTRMPGLWVARGVAAGTGLRQRILAAHDVLAQYGPVLNVRFTDTYIMFPEGVNLVYWPESPNWSQNVEPDFPLVTFEYFTISLPANNPQRGTVWTGIYLDEPSRQWMVSAITPVDMEGSHVATLGHDVLLNELMERTLNDRLPGAYNMLVRDDGQLIAHPGMQMDSGASVYNILDGAGPPGGAPADLSTAEQRAHLRSIFERVRNRPHGSAVLELPEYGEYIAVSRLQGPGWNFITVLPESVVSSAAFRAARYVLVFGLSSLFLELLIMSWVLRQQITRPLHAFTRATDQVAAGDFKVSLETSRDDELGRLAQGFQLMAREVQRREEALRQANEGLEQRVEERTRELKAVHLRLVDSARKAGMAEIATNVLHNVGNVLNSVATSALVAKERLTGLRVDQVGRLAGLFEEHRGNLAAFLGQDGRGRRVVPYMSQLGQNLLDERRELLSLMAEIGRYTEHIDAIVKLQQNYATKPQMQEAALLAGLVEDALRINSAGLGRHEVKVEQHLAPVPAVLIDKHKVLMILVNLISNAKYAVDTVPVEARRLSVRLEPPAGGRLRLEVRDTGIGIEREMLTRIFQYGFTTREGGHGFGLHSSALAAREMGGSLMAHSEGPGCGATFTLELPYTPAEGEGGNTISGPVQ